MFQKLQKLNLIWKKKKYEDYKKQYEIVVKIKEKIMFNQLKDAINWIETQVKFKPKTDLKRMAYAASLLKLSFDDIKLIHVAGTNGKGSVCSYLTHILLEKGLSVGTYTSPYLILFNERISFPKRKKYK